jgi:hypothetical protein
VTHRYTVLVGGTILPGPGHAVCSAIAWAEGTLLALGTDERVRSVSRGDSELRNLRGAYVVPIGAADMVEWPPSTILEVGGPADLAILTADPRAGTGRLDLGVTIVRGGHAVIGGLPSS